MKIYNKIVMDITTFDILYEDSYEYVGPVALCRDPGAEGQEGESGFGDNNNEGTGIGDTGYEGAGERGPDMPSGYGAGTPSGTGRSGNRTGISNETAEQEADRKERELAARKKGKVYGAIIGALSPIPGGALLGAILGDMWGKKQEYNDFVDTAWEAATAKGYKGTKDDVSNAVDIASSAIGNRRDDPDGTSGEDRTIGGVGTDNTVPINETDENLKAAGYSQDDISTLRNAPSYLRDMDPYLLMKVFPSYYDLAYVGTGEKGLQHPVGGQTTGTQQTKGFGVLGKAEGGSIDQNAADYPGKRLGTTGFKTTEKVLGTNGIADVTTGGMPTGIGDSGIGDSGFDTNVSPRDWLKTPPTTDQEAVQYINSNPAVKSAWDQIISVNPKWTPLQWARGNIGQRNRGQ